MNSLELELSVLNVSSWAAGFALNWLLQSTLLISAGLISAWLFRRRGSAFQSVVYRTTLAAVLLCPFVSIALSYGGMDGWSFKLPQSFVHKSIDAATLPGNAVSFDAWEGDQTIPAGRTAANSGINASIPSEPVQEVAFDGNAFDHGEIRHPDARPTSSEPAAASAVVPITERASADLAPASNADAIVVTTDVDIHVLDIFSFGLIAIGVATVWLIVAVILTVRLLFVMFRMNKLRSRAIEATEDEIAVCQRIASQMNVVPPQVLRAPFLTSPFLQGIRQPAVMLPDDAELPIADVFVHELAHLRRHDCHWLLLRQIATSVLFFQPLLWWLARRIDSTAEEVCDDYVVQLGGNRAGYAHSLVDIAALSATRMTIVGVGMVSLRSMLGQRVGRIMDTSRSLSTRVGNLLLVAVIGSGLIGTTITGFVGLSPQSSTATAATAVPNELPEVVEDETAADQATASEPPARIDGDKVRSAKTELSDAKDSAAKPENISGRIVGHDGKPVAGAKLHWFRTRVHDLDPMLPKLLAESDKHGNYSLTLPTIANPNDEPGSWNFHERIAVVAPGHAFNVIAPQSLKPKKADSVLGTLAEAVFNANGSGIELPVEGEPLRGRIVDIEGKPVVGATIRIRNYIDSKARSFLQTDLETRDKVGAEWRARVSHLLAVIEPVSQRFALPTARTNASGEFELQGLGADGLFQLLLEGKGIQTADVIARNVKAEKIDVAPGRQSIGKSNTVYGNDFLFVAGPSHPVTGRVTDLDSGEPIQNAVVRAFTVHGESVYSTRERQHFATRTDKDGRYRISGLPIGKENRLAAFTTDDVAYIPVGRPVDTSKTSDSIVEANFTLKRGVWAEGQVKDGETGKPFTGQMTYYWFRDRSLEKAIPGLFRSNADGLYFTNIRGEFRVPVLATRGIIAFRWDGDAFQEPRPIDKFPRGLGAKAIDGIDLRMNSFSTMPHSLYPGNYNYVAEINPEPGDERVQVEMSLRASKPVRLNVVKGDADAFPAGGYMVYGLNERWGWRRDQKTDLTVEDLLPDESRKVLVFHRKAGLAGAAVVDENVKQPVEIKLTKAGRVMGRLVDKNGDPIPDGILVTDYAKLWGDEPYAIWASHPKLSANPTKIPVDEEGRFELDGLIPGWKYSARVSAPRKSQGRMMSTGIGWAFSDLEIKPGESRDLGDVVVARRSPDSKKQASNTNETKDTISAKAVGETARTIRGRVVGPDGKPVQKAASARVYVGFPRYGGDDSSIRVAKPVSVPVKSDGSFQVTYTLRKLFENSESLPTELWPQAEKQVLLAAVADGFGPAVILGSELRGKEPITLRLAADQPVSGRLVSIEGQPVTGVRVRIESVEAAPDENIQPWIDQLKDGQGVGAATRANKLRRFALNVINRNSDTVTDRNGRFRISGIGRDRVLRLSATAPTMARQFFRMISRDTTSLPTNSGTGDQYGARVYGADSSDIVVIPSQPVVGVVRDAETKKPLSGVKIESYRLAGSNVIGNRSNLLTAKTNNKGEFRLTGMPKGNGNRLLAVPSDELPYFMREISVPELTGLAPIRLEVELHRGIWIDGKVVDGESGRGISASLYYLPFIENKFAGRLPEFTTLGNATIDGALGYQHRYRTRFDGSFRMVGLPGRGIVGAVTGGFFKKSYRPGAGSESIEGMDEAGTFATYVGPLRASSSWPNAMVEINPSEDDESVSVTLKADVGVPQRIRVTDQYGKRLTGYRVSGALESSHWNEPINNSEFDVSGLGRQQSRTILIQHAEKNLGKVVRIASGEDRSKTREVQLVAGCTVGGRVVDSLGQPIPNVQMRALTEPTENFNPYLRESVTTDKQGRFEFVGVPSGSDYRLTGRSRQMSKLRIRDVRFKTEPGKTIDMGTLTVGDDGRIATNINKNAANENKDEERVAESEKAKEPKSQPLGVGGQVIGPDGKPASGVPVVASIPAKGIVSLKAVTDKNGRFEFRGDRSAFDKAIRERARYQATITTYTEGLARDWRMKLMAELPGSDIRLQLRRFVTVEGRIVSAEGTPLANVEVEAADVSHPAGGMEEYIRRAKEDRLTYSATTDKWSMGGRLSTRTDSDGGFQFEKLGAERVVKLRLHGDGVADSEVIVVTRAAPNAAKTTGTLATTGTRNSPHYYSKFTHVAPASRTLQGIVLDEKTGKPIEGIAVSCLAASSGTTTKADGRFSFSGVLKAADYQFNIKSRTQPYFGKSLKVADTDGLKPIDIEFKLARGITAKGRVTDGKKPLDGVVYYNVLYPSPYADRISDFVQFQGLSEAVVQPDGSFEIQVLPGPGVLAFSVSLKKQDVVYLLPQVTEAALKKVLGDATAGRPNDGPRHISIHAGGPRVSAVGVVNHQALALIAPEETDTQVEVTLTATPGTNLKGTVVDVDGKPVGRIDVSMLVPRRLGLEPIAGNEFVIRGLGPGRPRRVVFYQPEIKQGAVLDLTGDEKPDAPLKVTLKSCGSLKGQLVDKNGNPVKNALVVLQRNNYGGNPNTWSARSGKTGEFKIDGLVPGEIYNGKLGAQTARGYVIRNVTAKTGETVDLSEVKVRDDLMVRVNN